MAIQFLNTVQVDTDVLYVDAENDRVGVGTNSPSTKLEISSSGVNGVDISESASNATQSGRLFFSTNTASEGFALFNSNGTLQINSGGIPNNTSGTNRVSIIGSSGNVGIGITSPDSKLHVYANNADAPTVVTIENGDTAVVAGQDLAKIQFLTNDVSAPGAGVAASIRAVCQNAGNIFDLAFNTQNGPTRTERMRLTGAGDLGLGTTSLTSISSTSRTLSLGSTSTTTSGGISSNS